MVWWLRNALKLLTGSVPCVFWTVCFGWSVFFPFFFLNVRVTSAVMEMCDEAIKLLIFYIKYLYSWHGNLKRRWIVVSSSLTPALLAILSILSFSSRKTWKMIRRSQQSCLRLLLSCAKAEKCLQGIHTWYKHWYIPKVLICPVINQPFRNLLKMM